MRVEDLTKFEGECPIIVVFSTYMDIRIPLTKKWKKIINEKKERSREEAFNIIQEWTKEFTEKYGNYYFDGSYYDEIDAFIEEKLRTI